MKTYVFDIKLSTKGEIKIRAKNKAEAKKIAEDDFGGLARDFHTSNSSNSPDESGVVTWEIETHLETKIL